MAVIFASVGSDGPASAEVEWLVTREVEKIEAQSRSQITRGKRDNV